MLCSWRATARLYWGGPKFGWMTQQCAIRVSTSHIEQRNGLSPFLQRSGEKGSGTQIVDVAFAIC
jgi:hypothetical protein